jgi:hypothetical protein
MNIILVLIEVFRSSFIYSGRPTLQKFLCFPIEVDKCGDYER